MKHLFHRAIKGILRTEFSARGDALRAESRADVARKCAEGKAWEGMSENVALLGIKADSNSRPKVVFGARR